MEPLFKAGDQVVINRLAYLFSPPKPGDIVAVRHPEKRDIILLKKIEICTPNNTYYVVGENKSDSEDSCSFGKVGKNLIFGKVLFRY